MLSIIAKYWLEYLLGLISLGLGFVAKRFYSMYKSEVNRQKDEEFSKIKDLIQENGEKQTIAINKNIAKSRESEANLQTQIDVIKEGILSIQRKTFMRECRELLNEDHVIVLAEFETIQEDYAIYKKLGGNHDGDALYALVKTKAGNNLSNQD